MHEIRMIDLARRHAEVAPEVEAAVVEVLRSGRYVGGPMVERAEALVAGWFGREAAAGVASGTDALILALQAVGVRPGDEVVVPALSFFATAGAVCRIGAVPVVVDVREDGCLDPEACRRALTPRTRAIVPVHLFGNPAPCPDFGIPVVDDAAQAVGTGPEASSGILTALSAYPTKTWGAAGDAGFVLGAPEAVERVRALGNHGTVAPHLHRTVEGVVGRNSRLDAIQAAVLLGHADALERRVAARRRNAAWYDAHLPPSVRPLPRHPASAVHVYAVQVDARDAVREALAARGVETGVYYPRPLHAQPALSHAVAHPTPVADALCARMLALPVHSGLGRDDLVHVVESLREVRP